MKLKDKIAIVTGAGQGLGRAIALMLGEEGAVVAVVGRTTSKLESVAAEITQAGGRAWPITADLTEEDQVQGMVDQVMEKYGRIDILVNNAGGYPKEMYDISTQSPLKIWEWKPEQWDQIIRTNLRIPFLCMNKVTPVMREQRFGDIVSVSSRMGRIASEMGAYAVAKGGIVTLTKTAAIQMKEYGVRCNAVAPTIVDTPGHADFGGEVERILKMVNGVILLVDAAEGPMPQTRFVLQKALELGHKVIVAVNKIDKPDARVHEVMDEVLELLLDLNATDEQFNSPTVFCSGRQGTASYSPDEAGTDLTPLFETIVNYIPAPEGDDTAPLQLLVSSIDYNDYVGRIAVGRVERGTIKVNQEVTICDFHDANVKTKGKVVALYEFDGLSKNRPGGPRR